MMSQPTNTTCTQEPWGRYSASGGLYKVEFKHYMYSFGGDTLSDADGEGGIVRTNWRFSLADSCWEQLASGPTHIGYRSTATQVSSLPDIVWVLFGSDQSRAATDQVYQYSLSQDNWTLVPFETTTTTTTTTTTATTTTTTPAARWKHAAVAIDERRILVTGGREGNTVHSDAWIFNTADLTWSPLQETTLPPMYRHGMAFDDTRNVVWIYGGLDDTFSRFQSELWKLNLTSNETVEVTLGGNNNDNPPPPRLASHAIEYIKEIDVLVLWGGTCDDDSELHIYDIVASTWCRIFPANRPDKRDAMLWSLRYPHFYIAQGDSICYQQVLPIADVHVLDFSTMDYDGSVAWDLLYEPYNARGTGNEPYCNGINAGNCQPRPRLNDMGGREGTCSADLLARFLDYNVSSAVSNSSQNNSSSGNSSTSPMTFPETTTNNSGTKSPDVPILASKAPPPLPAPKPLATSAGYSLSYGTQVFPLTMLVLVALSKYIWK